MPRGLLGDPHRLQGAIAWEVVKALSPAAAAPSLFTMLSCSPKRATEVTAILVWRRSSRARRSVLGSPIRVFGVAIEWGMLIMISSLIDRMTSLTTRVNGRAVNARHLRG